MYMTPGVPLGGGLWWTHASAHLPALASKHIGSGPGVSGASGMQVQPFLPARTCFIAPLASTVTTAASCASDAGAADSALATGSAFEVPDAELVFVSAVAVLLVAIPDLLQALAARAAPAISRMRKALDVMNPLHCLRGPAD